MIVRAFLIRCVKYINPARIAIFALCLQFLFWLFIGKNVKPDFIITPNPPSKFERAVISFGDYQWLYRSLTQSLQNAGDTFGETVAMKDYDYNIISRWLTILNEMDNKAQYVPSLAAFYFAQSQNPQQTIPIIKYLESYADRDPVNQWRWYLEAIFIAQYKLHDTSVATRIAEKISILNGSVVPLWAKTLVPFILAKKGDTCAAYKLLKNISQQDLDLMSQDSILATGSTDNKNDLLILLKAKINAIMSDRQLLLSCAFNK